MSGVLSGFFIVWCVIGVGYVAGRAGILGTQGRYVLNRFTFFIASPCLMFVSLLGSDLVLVFSTPLLVAGSAGLATGALFLLLSRFVLRRDGTTAVIGSISASVVNGANLGFPIAAYVLGDISHAVPVILFQQAVYTPIYMMALELTTSGRRPSPGAILRGVARNPTIIAVLIGTVVLVVGVEVPDLLMQPIDVIAGASIPTMLIAFGLSLVGSHPFAKAAGQRTDTIAATVFKLIVMPLIGFAVGAFGFGLSGFDLYAVVVMAALPTAQNVYVAASRFEAGEVLARDAVLLTTVFSVLTLLVAATVLGS